MNLNQINKHLRPLGVFAVRGKGYYYWDTVDKAAAVDAPSVYVCRASQLSLDHWVHLAAEAASQIWYPKPLPEIIRL